MMNLTSWRKVAGQVFRDRADKLRAGLEISHVGLRLEGKWTVVALVPSRPFCQHDHSATHRPVAMADNDDRVNTEITGHPTKWKKNNSASCSTSFTIKPFTPPSVTCSASVTTVKSGETATITANATSQDGAQISNYAYTTSAGKITGNGTSATLDTTGLPGSTVSVTVTATDSHGLSASCTASVGVVEEMKCVSIEDWGECTFEKNPKKPWRVDNDCKDTLDKLSLRLQQMPTGKVEIVGYTDQTESVDVKQLGAQRSVNVKYYLT